MIPSGGIVACPSESVALASGICGAGQHERALVGAQLEQAVESGAGILESDDVVNFRVRRRAGREARLFDAVNRTERHRLVRTIEDRWLIHVIPEPCNAVLNKLMVETSPPFSSLGTGEIRKDRRARPDDADKLASIGILH